VHLDVKPSNFFVDGFGQMKLGDFGMTKKLTEPMDDDVEGDCVYLAKEIIESRIISDKADMFSLGLSLLEIILEMELPKQGTVWSKLRNNEFESIINHMDSKMPQEMKELVLNLIDKSPENRCSAEQALMKYSELKKRSALLAEGNYTRYINRLNLNNHASDTQFPNTPEKKSKNVNYQENKKSTMQMDDDELSLNATLSYKNMNFN